MRHSYYEAELKSNRLEDIEVGTDVTIVALWVGLSWWVSPKYMDCLRRLSNQAGGEALVYGTGRGILEFLPSEHNKGRAWGALVPCRHYAKWGIWGVLIAVALQEAPIQGWKVSTKEGTGYKTATVSTPSLQKLWAVQGFHFPFLFKVEGDVGFFVPIPSPVEDTPWRGCHFKGEPPQEKEWE